MPGSEVTGLIALSGPPPLGQCDELSWEADTAPPPVCRVSPSHRNAEGIKYSLFFVSGLGFVCVS